MKPSAVGVSVLAALHRQIRLQRQWKQTNIHLSFHLLLPIASTYVFLGYKSMSLSHPFYPSIVDLSRLSVRNILFTFVLCLALTLLFFGSTNICETTFFPSSPVRLRYWRTELQYHNPMPVVCMRESIFKTFLIIKILTPRLMWTITEEADSESVWNANDAIVYATDDAIEYIFRSKCECTKIWEALDCCVDGCSTTTYDDYQTRRNTV